MKQQIFIRKAFLLLVLLFALVHAQAQQSMCSFKEPVVKIDFGTAGKVSGVNELRLSNYHIDGSVCPNDDYYSFASHTSDCFNGDWLTFNEDHTLGDKRGRMMLVNASPDGGIFFNTVLTNLQPNTTYEFSAWMVNVCRISGGCPPLPPNIAIKIFALAGKKIASFQTGLLSQNATPRWKVYSGLFTTPASTDTFILIMEDITRGGCGNDFALDDITIRERIVQAPASIPVVKQQVKRVEKNMLAVTKPVEKKMILSLEPVIKKSGPKYPAADTIVPTVKNKITDSGKIPGPAIKDKHPVLIPAPTPILTRANPLIKQIETEAGEIVINLYDNGTVDGDTVSVYDNNQLIVSRAGLSLKPITFRIKVDASHPYHELIMVANNLGSIPPNTSTMIATIGNKSYEIFISSSEEMNAKVLIKLKD